MCMCLFTLKVGFEQRLLYSSINTFLDHDDDDGNQGARKNGKIEPFSLSLFLAIAPISVELVFPVWFGPCVCGSVSNLAS